MSGIEPRYLDYRDKQAGYQLNHQLSYPTLYQLSHSPSTNFATHPSNKPPIPLNLANHLYTLPPIPELSNPSLNLASQSTCLATHLSTKPPNLLTQPPISLIRHTSLYLAVHPSTLPQILLCKIYIIYVRRKTELNL
jgi:hypothetical protein